MSERNPRHHERQEFKASPVETENQVETQGKTQESEATPDKPQASIEELARRVESEAISKEEAPADASLERKQHPVFVSKQLKAMSYSRTMVRVRKKLSAPSRAFSKLVHSPVLEQPSELASKTIARPSSMLGGALCSLLGTVALYWVVNRYGYEYNYLAIIILFAGGWSLGLIIEATFRSLRKRKSR
jgi:hypothetical protein